MRLTFVQQRGALDQLLDLNLPAALIQTYSNPRIVRAHPVIYAYGFCKSRKLRQSTPHGARHSEFKSRHDDAHLDASDSEPPILLPCRWPSTRRDIYYFEISILCGFVADPLITFSCTFCSVSLQDTLDETPNLSRRNVRRRTLEEIGECAHMS